MDISKRKIKFRYSLRWEFYEKETTAAWFFLSAFFPKAPPEVSILCGSPSQEWWKGIYSSVY